MVGGYGREQETVGQAGTDIRGARGPHLGPWTGKAPCGPIRTKKREACAPVKLSAYRRHQRVLLSHSPPIAPRPPVKFALIFLAPPLRAAAFARTASTTTSNICGGVHARSRRSRAHGPYAIHCPPDMKRCQAAHEHQRSKPRQHTTTTPDKQKLKRNASPPTAAYVYQLRYPRRSQERPSKLDSRCVPAVGGNRAGGARRRH